MTVHDYITRLFGQKCVGMPTPVELNAVVGARFRDATTATAACARSLCEQVLTQTRRHLSAARLSICEDGGRKAKLQLPLDDRMQAKIFRALSAYEVQKPSANPSDFRMEVSKLLTDALCAALTAPPFGYTEAKATLQHRDVYEGMMYEGTVYSIALELGFRDTST